VKTYRAAIPNAREVLRQKSGDCKAHSVLLAALARSLRLPARTVSGLVGLADGKFYYHEWVEVWVGDWLAADAVFNQVNADATHIKLGQGDLLDQAKAIVSAIGSLRLEVIDYRMAEKKAP
jgi:transglutaminase-like putative cysteine protease